MQKSVAFLYTNNEQAKKEKQIKKKNSTYNSIKKNEILRNKSNQEGKRLVL